MSTNTIYSKYFYVYKITNLINNKIYIGVHQSTSLDDDYMGSGIHLKRAQSKYGIENFKKEILFIYDNKEDMFSKEKELVNESFVQDKNTYNLKVGGDGGWDYINSNPEIKSIAGKNRQAAHMKKYLNDNEYKINFHNKIKESLSSDEIKKKISDGVKKHLEENGHTWDGKKHSDETKLKMANSHKGKHAIENNSQYGTIWIYSLEEKRNMKINKDNDIPEGWYKGRKMKF